MSTTESKVKYWDISALDFRDSKSTTPLSPTASQTTTMTTTTTSVSLPSKIFSFSVLCFRVLLHFNGQIFRSLLSMFMRCIFGNIFCFVFVMKILLFDTLLYELLKSKL